VRVGELAPALEHREIGSGSFLVAGCDATELLETIDASFNQVAPFVCLRPLARCRSASLLGYEDLAMEIESTSFGTITLDGKTYEHDVVVRLSGEVVKRKKKLSKKYYGTSHILSKDEAKFVFEKGCEQLIVGSGQISVNSRLGWPIRSRSASTVDVFSLTKL
jgi:hypothetical protein